MSRSVNVMLVISFLLLVAVNIAFLDFVIFLPKKFAPENVSTVATPAPQSILDTDCPNSCRALIAREQAVRVLSSTPSNQESDQISSVPVAAKEYVIPIGSGVVKSDSWQDVAGAEATVDTRNYPPIKSVTLEVYLKIPTANGQIRAKLFNVTDKHDVWFSEVFSEGPVLTKKEVSVALEQGLKTYRIMGLSTLRYEANVENARLRIVTY
ncbi:MAG: hypothetical protein UY10_C0003G0044 [Microgenomates group bacterium GW2011_GWA2_47_8]|nr:MAG: hypothetical protein UY10_C0003G0044 [Microgenomates group bacterium GW2011_GWA2_47_8]